MRIQYKKKQVNLNLYLGLLWLVNGIIQTVRNENVDLFDYSWFLISGIYLLIYFYQKKEKYLTLENGFIKQNWPFGKKLNLNEIKWIKKFAGDYILKTDEKELAINTQIINPSSLTELNAVLEKLNVEWT